VSYGGIFALKKGGQKEHFFSPHTGGVKDSKETSPVRKWPAKIKKKVGGKVQGGGGEEVRRFPK